jgi:adenylosuccinate lyase
MTSSDVLDTALSVRMVEAGNMILEGLRPVMKRCAQLARRYIDVPIAGRTHGVFAEPTSVGLKFALWYADLVRARRRIKSAVHSAAVGKLSGAVGNFAHLDPRVERYVCRRLKLRPAPISTQVVQRDRHAEYVFAMAALAAEGEKIAQEIRLLHRTETGEITEGFFAGQRGSSAMPHKKNPIVSERICGLARLLRGFVTTSLENVALWHERDISHSSVERVVIPDTTILTDYILHLLDELLANIGVHKDRAHANLQRWGGSVFSQRLLLVLADRLGSRDKAYVIVQKLAQESTPESPFEETVRGNALVRENLSDDEISDVFDLSHFLRHARSIMRRALGLK